MGYSMVGDREIYSFDEIAKEFDYKRIGYQVRFLMCKS